MIHGHGDDLYRSGYEVRANFSTNVWYGADMEGLLDYLKGHLGAIGHYPEPDAGAFREAAAFYHGLRPENVLAGNGATELFYLIAHAFAGGRTVLPVPSFTEYEDACRMYGHEVEFVPLGEEPVVPAGGDLLFVCNPNNPDGRVWKAGEIRALLVDNPERVIVVDESFIRFAPEAESAIPLLGECENLLVVCSMTKCYAIPGLRLGYVLGNEGLIKRLGRFSLPWSVNALAIAAGQYLLRHGEAAAVFGAGGQYSRFPTPSVPHVVFPDGDGFRFGTAEAIPAEGTWVAGAGCFKLPGVGQALFPRQYLGG